MSVIGQVTSSDEIGVVHWSPGHPGVDVVSASDDIARGRLAFTLDHFSNIALVRAGQGYGLYQMRWSVPVIRTDASEEFTRWQAQTSGITFAQGASGFRNIVINQTDSRLSPCGSGTVTLQDQWTVTCLPSVSRPLGSTDQVQIFRRTIGSVSANATALRHAIGHALGIAHPHRVPPLLGYPPLLEPDEWPVMASLSFISCGRLGCPAPPQFSRLGLHAQDIAAIRAKYGPVAPTPTLLTPLPDAPIPQNVHGGICATPSPTDPKAGYGYQLALDWSDVQGATQYRLVVGRDGSAPIADILWAQSQVHFFRCYVVEPDAELTGWSWQVQALVGGVWSPFSSPRAFSFLPCRLADGSPCRHEFSLPVFYNGYSFGPQVGVVNSVVAPQRLFEDFTLSQNTVIRNISWQQHDHLESPYTNTEVLIFAGLPYASAPVFSATVTATRFPNYTGVLFGDRYGYDYEIDGLAISLPAGTYWLGLNTNHEGGPGTSWDNTTVQADTVVGYRRITQTFPAPGEFVAGNLGFTLR
jgi:hypothetical protein